MLVNAIRRLLRLIYDSFSQKIYFSIALLTLERLKNNK